MDASVLCVGHACYDIIFPLGEFPGENRKYKTAVTEESPGGPACNAASLLGKWGVPCALACLFGDDMYAGLVIKEMRAWGVDMSLCEKREGHATPLSCVITNSANGSRTIINRRDSEKRLGLGEKDFLRAFSVPPRVLLFDGHEPDASLAAMRAFPAALTVLDAGSLREGTDILCRCVDYCVASETFAREAAGYAGDEESLTGALRELVRRGARHAAITLGEKGGCYLAEESLRRYAPCAAHALDSTAAGDIFHGAFVWAVLQGCDFPAALRFSAVAAGLSVERRGGRDSIPSLEETLLRAGRAEIAQGGRSAVF